MALRWPTTVTAKEKDTRQKEEPYGKKGKDSRQKKKHHSKRKKPHGKKKRLMSKEKTSFAGRLFS